MIRYIASINCERCVSIALLAVFDYHQQRLHHTSAVASASTCSRVLDSDSDPEPLIVKKCFGFFSVNLKFYTIQMPDSISFSDKNFPILSFSNCIPMLQIQLQLPHNIIRYTVYHVINENTK